MISPGTRLLADVVNDIIANPETWDQSTWHSDCGTKHCIAGWGQIRSGKPVDNRTVGEDAIEAYEIAGSDAGWLFLHCRTLAEIRHFAETKLLGYDRDGYDRDGFDRYGHDRHGGGRFDLGRLSCRGLYSGGKLLPLVIPAE